MIPIKVRMKIIQRTRKTQSFEKFKVNEQLSIRNYLKILSKERKHFQNLLLNQLIMKIIFI